MFKRKEILIKAEDIAFLYARKWVWDWGRIMTIFTIMFRCYATNTEVVIGLCIGIILSAVSSYMLNNVVEANKWEYYSWYTPEEWDVDIISLKTRKYK